MAAELRYDEKLLRRLPADKDSWVRGLCERSHPKYAAYADTLTRWFNELGGSQTMRRRLTSANDTEFQAGRWELTAGRLFHNLGFEVTFDPLVKTTVEGADPKTPDFRAVMDDLKPLVEVFNLNPSAAETAEDELRTRLSDELAGRLFIDSGFLSLVLSPGHDLQTYPHPAAVDALASAIQRWWDGGRASDLRLNEEQIAVRGLWMPTDTKLTVVVAPGARFLSPDRISDRLARKLGNYKNLHGEQIVLFVASDYWTHTASTMVDAMFGNQEIPLITAADGTPAAGQPRFSGQGLLTEDAVFGHPASRLIAGCMFANHGMFNAETGSWDVYAQYVHNPYADKRLPNGLFDPFPEMQVLPDVMRWTTEDHGSFAMP